jgi:hypothetical protein
MKFVAILCLALVAAVSAEGVVEATSEIAAAAQQTAAEVAAMPQVDADLDEAEEESFDEEADEAVEEGEDEAEAEEESEEEDMALLEAGAEADADAEGEAEVDAEGKPKKNKKTKAKIVGKPKAPVAITAKPFKFHPERVIEAQTSKFEDPEMAKLNLALSAVKQDILATNKQITDERKWVIAVAKIIASYNDKMKRVEAHIIALRKEMKNLYRKKKQIENLKLQKALEAKLKEARDELATLTSSLKHVAVKQGELNRSGSDLRNTIAGIQAQLAKLRGQQLRRPKPAVRGKRRAGRRGARRASRKCGKGKRYSRRQKKCVARNAKKL